MKTRESVLEHLQYALTHVDGLYWLCDRLLVGIPRGEVTITIGGRSVIVRPSFAFLQNPLAEAGLIYCRKLLDFLGLKVKHSGADLYERKSPYTDDTIGIEDLKLQRVGLCVLDSTPFGDAEKIRSACVHTIRAANKGVAHFTEDRGERAEAQQLLLCAEVVRWLIEKHVYEKLNLQIPAYRIWTVG